MSTRSRYQHTDGAEPSACRLSPFLLGAIALAACAAGGNDTGRVSCASDTDCAAGWACDKGECARLCNDSEDCPPAERCEGGVCVIVASPECSADADCTTPTVCHVVEKRRCVGGACTFGDPVSGLGCDDAKPCTIGDTCDAAGTCVGSPKPCNTPPANMCINGDTEITVYSDLGLCNPTTGLCVYYSKTTACDPCPACLSECNGIDCTAAVGGCELTGVCVPLTPPPTPAYYCSYQIAGDGNSCELAGLPSGNQAGVCKSGVCVECREDANCNPSQTCNTASGVCEP